MGIHHDDQWQDDRPSDRQAEEGSARRVQRDERKARVEFRLAIAFKERRCLIPMSSWDEWPETGAGKHQSDLACHAHQQRVVARVLPVREVGAQ